MVRYRSEWPSQDELVMCTVTKVFEQGAFVALDEYRGKEGMVHITEVASGWIKNIRDHVREGQKVVCKVLSVNPDKGLIDLSVRRVKAGQRRWKTEQWKREQRAEKMLELAANRLQKDLNRAYEEAGFLLQDKFGGLYPAFELAASKGEGPLLEAGLSKQWAKAISEICASSIEMPTFKVTGYADLSCPGPDGVKVLRSAMMSARDIPKGDGVSVEFYYVGSPRYRIEVIAPSYKAAEDAMQRAADAAIEMVRRAGGSGSFTRAG